LGFLLRSSWHLNAQPLDSTGRLALCREIAKRALELDRDRSLKLSKTTVITTLMTITNKTNFDFVTGTNKKLKDLLKNETASFTKTICKNGLGGQAVISPSFKNNLQHY
jgi:hypothetical protein